jgi:hypothetical protein
MAKFNDIELFDPMASTSGALLYLENKATAHAKEQTVGGAEIEVIGNSRAVVVRNVEGADHIGTRNAAINAAQEGLDLLAIRAEFVGSLDDVEKQHITWFQSQTGKVSLRWVATSLLRLSVGIPRVTVTHADGSVDASERPAISWHESLRYFRRAQTTHDLFDAFRNLYLALESILSSIAPQKMGSDSRPSEGESQWFRRALTEAHKSVPLGSYARAPLPVNPVQDIFDEVYVDVRTSIFHAKLGRSYFLPYEKTGRGRVAPALDRLGKLYLALVDHFLGIRFAQGGMFAGGFKAMVGEPHSQLTVQISNDPSPAAESDTSMAPQGGSVFECQTVPAKDLEAPFFTAIMGLVGGEKAASHLGVVRRAGGIAPDGTVVLVHDLEGSLSLEHVEEFQVVMGLRGENARTLRTRYLS